MRRSRAGAQERRGLLERFLFSFMGPPQLGDPNEPTTVLPDPGAALCPKCGRSWDEHEHVRTPTHSYVNCPAG